MINNQVSVDDSQNDSHCLFNNMFDFICNISINYLSIVLH